MTDAGGAWANAALQAAAIVATGKGTSMRIEEGIADYEQEVRDIEARQAEVAREASRRIGRQVTLGPGGAAEFGASAAAGGALAPADVLRSWGGSSLLTGGWRAVNEAIATEAWTADWSSSHPGTSYQAPGLEAPGVLGEGIRSLKEQGAQAAYEGKMALTKAELVSSGEESRLAKSGVRMAGSPLLAAQQNVDLAYAAADRTVESGNAAMGIGGIRLQNTISDIHAQASLVTSEYERRRQEALRKRDELEKNKKAMVLIAAAGGAPGLGTAFYKAGVASDWWK